jgi:Na+/alanine symporter
MPFFIARIAAVIMLFLALARLPYGYYTLLRFVVCGTTAYGAYLASTEQKKPAWAWIFGIIAVLFNPFIPVHITRDIWAVIDIAVALLLVVSLLFLREPKSPPADS